MLKSRHRKHQMPWHALPVVKRHPGMYLAVAKVLSADLVTGDHLLREKVCKVEGASRVVSPRNSQSRRQIDLRVLLLETWAMLDAKPLMPVEANRLGIRA